jgi:hypothetical protein
VFLKTTFGLLLCLQQVSKNHCSDFGVRGFNFCVKGSHFDVKGFDFGVQRYDFCSGENGLKGPFRNRDR